MGEEADGTFRPPELECRAALTVVQESGDYGESVTSMHLRPESGSPPDAEEEVMVKWCSAALYAGGADTVRARHVTVVAWLKGGVARSSV